MLSRYVSVYSCPLNTRQVRSAETHETYEMPFSCILATTLISSVSFSHKVMEIAYSSPILIITMKIAWTFRRVLRLVQIFVSARGFSPRPSNSAIFENPLAKFF